MGVERRSGATEPEYATMGDRLRQARRARGLSLRGLAEVVGVSPSLISQVETGRAKPSVNTLYALATELGISLDVLLFMDTQPPAQNGAGEAFGSTAGDHVAARSRAAGDVPIHASGSGSGRRLGAADDRVDPQRGLPPRDLRGRRRVEPGRRLPAALRARSGATS